MKNDLSLPVSFKNFAKKNFKGRIEDRSLNPGPFCAAMGTSLVTRRCLPTSFQYHTCSPNLSKAKKERSMGRSSHRDCTKLSAPSNPQLNSIGTRFVENTREGKGIRFFGYMNCGFWSWTQERPSPHLEKQEITSYRLPDVWANEP